MNLDLSGVTDRTAPEASPAPVPGTFTLEAPPPVPVVTVEQASTAVTIEDTARTAVEAKAEAFASQLVAVTPSDPEFVKALENIRTMGSNDMVKSSEVSNRMLARPAAQAGSGSPQSQVGTTLVTLRGVVTDLDPNRADLTGVKKLLKFLPGGNKVDAYFQRYRSAESQLNDIMAALDSGQDELRKDNAAILGEQRILWDTIQRLKEYDVLAVALDGAVTAKIAAVRGSGDIERAQAMESEVLFAVRQRHQDILTQMAVATQGYMALGMIHKNNIELVKGVDRAKTTTMSALRTAVIVSQALGQQKLVLDQISAVNSATSDMILRTSEQLKQQSAQIHAQAASSTVDVASLQAAFSNIYETMDAIDTFRAQANTSMAATVETLRGELVRADRHLGRAQVADSDAAQVRY